MQTRSVALTAAMLFGLTGFVSAQPQTGPNDGKYVGSLKCFPSGATSRLNGLTIRQSKFNFTFTFSGSSRSCAVELQPDGTFSNENCALPMSGKVAGEQLNMKFKSPDAYCDVSATRERP